MRRGIRHSRPVVAFVTVILLLTASGTAGAQSIAKTVATLRLHTPEIISSRQFATYLDLAVRLRGGTPLTAQECRPALDRLIDQHLYQQESDKRRLTPTEAEIDEQMAVVRKRTEQGSGRDRKFSEDEWLAVIQQNLGLSLQEYRDQLIGGVSTQRLVAQMRPNLMQGIEPATEQEIKRFYNANIQQFVQPDMVLIQHIHFSTAGLDQAGIEQARARADEVLRELRASASFDDMVVKSSDDGTSRYRGGELGNRYLRRDDPIVIETLGAPFLEVAFTLAVGDISGVVASNVGFHILRLTDRLTARLLTLSHPVTPRSSETVNEQIAVLLDSRRQTQAYMQAVEEIAQELRGQADVRIFEENVCQSDASR